MTPRPLLACAPLDPARAPRGLDVPLALFDEDAAPRALVSGINLLSLPPGAIESLPLRELGGVPLAVRSGWVDPPGDEPAGAWLPSVQASFQAAVDALESTARDQGATIWWWPASGHALSDIPSILSFFRARAGRHHGLLLEPAALLAPSMLERGEEHLARAYGALSALASCVLVSSVGAGDSLEGSACVGVDRGVIPPGILARLVEEHVPCETPLALYAPGEDRQAELLRRAVVA